MTIKNINHFFENVPEFGLRHSFSSYCLTRPKLGKVYGYSKHFEQIESAIWLEYKMHRNLFQVLEMIILFSPSSSNQKCASFRKAKYAEMNRYIIDAKSIMIYF